MFRSEWSAPSDAVQLKAIELEPVNVLCCEWSPQPALEAFGVYDQLLHFAFPAFASFDARSPLPVEYCIEAWQRPDLLGAASEEELQAYDRPFEQPLGDR